MTDTIVTEEKKVIPFLKFGAFDANNYAPKKAKEIAENEKKYGTVRLLAGQTVSGEITGFFDSPNGQLMYLKDAVIDNMTIGRVKIPLTTALDSLIVKKLEKISGEKVSIKYRGLKESKANAGKTYHDCEVI